MHSTTPFVVSDFPKENFVSLHKSIYFDQNRELQILSFSSSTIPINVMLCTLCVHYVITRVHYVMASNIHSVNWFSNIELVLVK